VVHGQVQEAADAALGDVEVGQQLAEDGDLDTRQAQMSGTFRPEESTSTSRLTRCG